MASPVPPMTSTPSESRQVIRAAAAAEQRGQLSGTLRRTGASGGEEVINRVVHIGPGLGIKGADRQGVEAENSA